MKTKLNKILILFIFGMVIFFIITWEILQSNWVAERVSQITTSYLERVFDSEVKIDNIEFNFFPPGAKLNKVSFQGKIGGNSLEAVVKSIGAYFSLFDIFNTSFHVDTIAIDQAEVKFQTENSKSQKSQTSSEDSSPLDIFEKLRDIPIKKIELNESLLAWQGDSLYVKKLNVVNGKSFLETKGKVGRFSLEKIINKKNYIDQVEFDAQLDRTELKINNLQVQSNLETINLYGSINNYASKNFKLDLKANASLNLNSLHRWLSFEHVGVLRSGVAEVSAALTGSRKKFTTDINIKAENFVTDFVYGKKANANIKIDQDHIVFNTVAIEDGEQKFALIKPFEFYNFKTNKFVEEPIIAEVEKLKFDNFLSYLKDETSFMNGRVSGKIRFDLYANSFSFKVVDQAKVDEFYIRAGNDFDIISLKDFDLENGMFQVDSGVFSMNTLLKKGKTNLNVIGNVGKGDLKFTIPLAYVEFEKFEAIANQKLTGSGTLSFYLNQEDQQIKIKTQEDFKNITCLGLKLDKLKATTKFNLARNEIDISKFSATSGKAKATGNLKINYNQLSLEGKYSVSQLSFGELKKILGENLSTVQINAKDINGLFNAEGDISGGLSFPGIKVSGNLFAKSVYIFDESLDSLKLNFNLEGNQLSLFRILMDKGKGQIKGKFDYDFLEKKFQLATDINHIAIQDLNVVANFPTTIKGNLTGYFSLGYDKDAWSANSFLNLTETYAVSKPIEDTVLKIQLDQESLDVSLNGFGDKIKLKTKTNFTKDELSFVNLDLKFDDIKDALILISGVDLLNMEISGDVDYTANISFDYRAKKIVDTYLNTKRLNFNKGPVKISYFNEDPEIIIQNGLIEKWKTDIKGKNFYLISKGSGNLLGDYISESQMKVDASVVEIFNQFVTKANGHIRGKFIVGNKGTEPIYEAYLSSSNLTLNSNYLPTAITKAETRISFLDKKIDIQKFKAQLVSGMMDVKGSIDFHRIIPDINLKYKFEDAGFVVLNKSNLIFSGQGDLIGKNFPYTISGDFYIKKFTIINELTDFGFSGSGFKSSEIDYLPDQELLIKNQLLNFNINVITREPIFIRNSLADLGFLGNLQVLGGEQDIRLAGKINLAPRNNKVTFKNNEFSFSKGNIIFGEDKNYKNPTLDFLASSRINGIGIDVQLVGNVRDYDLRFISDKNLSQTDILSLIIFGYTEDLSNNLSAAEKESMTRAGVGSILFDSFKINETLKDEFGLQVNLGTEISKTEGNYLSQKNSDNTTGRVRSATTFEIKKKVSDATSLTVLGTVSSSSTQKRAVNLNYKINQNVSVEGVYESISTNNSETINRENSVGADVKWKWSFK